jgi:hypothetical protein
MKADNIRDGIRLMADEDGLEPVIAEILRSIRNVRFGSVEITIHDSRVVQIERKEKVRFAPAPRSRIG